MKSVRAVGTRRFRGHAPLLLIALLAAVLGSAETASAFDLFGLFGSDAPPPLSPTTLPYTLDFKVVGDDGVTSALQDGSTMYGLRHDAPPDGTALVQRLDADFSPMLDALWGAGYYNARLTARVAGTTVDLGQPIAAAGTAIEAANRLRNRAVVPVTIVVDTGPLFRIGAVRVVDAATGRRFPDEDLPPRVVKLRAGDPARAEDIRASDARLVDYFRARAHPLVKVPLPQPTVDHAAQTMDVTFAVETGPVAGFGAVSVKGPDTFDPAIVRSFVDLRPGQPYTPKALADTRRAVAALPAVGSVRVREADHLDAQGNLPIFLDVTDRKPNLIGFSAGFSTVDGPTSSVYYENRNLFGGAERLRIQGDVFLAPRIEGRDIGSFKDIKPADIGERITLSFVKPALNGSRVDLLLDGIAERNRVGGVRFGGYEDRLAGGTAALRYRLDETTSLQAGLKYESGQTRDTLGRIDYHLVGLPVLARYDTTDSLLDPTTGLRLNATLTPYATALGSSVGFTRATATGSAYHALDDEGRFILAGRVSFGSVFGESGGLGTIPANSRFYVGGLDSVRGYQFHTIAPTGGPNGFITGGLSAFSAQMETRIKVTETIGVAPFFDIAGAYTGAVPFSGGATRSSAGLGVLYYTPIGPVRIDLATPLDPRRPDHRLVLYVSIGQPF